jgi:hypothetical protein
MQAPSEEHGLADDIEVGEAAGYHAYGVGGGGENSWAD